MKGKGTVQLKNIQMKKMQQKMMNKKNNFYVHVEGSDDDKK